VAALTSYHWPGNVRELRNVVERLLAIGDLGTAESDMPAEPENYHVSRRYLINRFERAFVRASLDACDGVVSRAAARAGISRQMFHRLTSRYGSRASGNAARALQHRPAPPRDRVTSPGWLPRRPRIRDLG
jgi:transcriptional regulator of acetoin/glycerol metabolism